MGTYPAGGGPDVLAGGLHLPEVSLNQVQQAAVDAAVFPAALDLEPVQEFPGDPQAQVHFPGSEPAPGSLLLGGHARILPLRGGGGKK